MAKFQKIVEVELKIRYSDGAQRKLRGTMNEAMRYFSGLRLQYDLRSLAGIEYDLPAIEKQMKQLEARRLEILAAKRASARNSRGPAKYITKAQLISFRGLYQQGHHGKTRGWKKAACADFLIDGKTLNSRMTE